MRNIVRLVPILFLVSIFVLEDLKAQRTSRRSQSDTTSVTTPSRTSTSGRRSTDDSGSSSARTGSSGRTTRNNDATSGRTTRNNDATSGRTTRAGRTSDSNNADGGRDAGAARTQAEVNSDGNRGPFVLYTDLTDDHVWVTNSGKTDADDYANGYCYKTDGGVWWNVAKNNNLSINNYSGYVNTNKNQCVVTYDKTFKKKYGKTKKQSINNFWILVEDNLTASYIEVWSLNMYTEFVAGCTDVTAANYDATAGTDDGSCIDGINNLAIGDDAQGGWIYKLSSDGKSGDVMSKTEWTDTWADAKSRCDNLTVTVGGIVIYNNWSLPVTTQLTDMSSGIGTTAPAGTTVRFGRTSLQWTGSNKNGPYGQSYQVAGEPYPLDTKPINVLSRKPYRCMRSFPLTRVPGCTSPTAFNYKWTATEDDGNCIAVVNGCTDATAANYDATANTNTDIISNGYGPYVFYSDLTDAHRVMSNACSWSKFQTPSSPYELNDKATGYGSLNSSRTSCSGRTKNDNDQTKTSGFYILVWDNLDAAGYKISSEDGFTEIETNGSCVY